MCSMMCRANHISQSIAPVSFASTSSLRSRPTVSTVDVRYTRLRIFSDAHHQAVGGEHDDDRVCETEARIPGRGEILAPVPAEPLCEEVGNRERDLERRAEARDVSCDMSRVWRLYLSGVVWRSHASPTIPAVASQDWMESICSAGVGDLQAATRAIEMTKSRFTRT
jgi:hypothetical protein